MVKPLVLFISLRLILPWEDVEQSVYKWDKLVYTLTQQPNRQAGSPERSGSGSARCQFPVITGLCWDFTVYARRYPRTVSALKPPDRRMAAERRKHCLSWMAVDGRNLQRLSSGEEKMGCERLFDATHRME